MQITYEEFCKTLKPGGFHKVGLHAIPRAHKILTSYYCNYLTVRGACSSQCAVCLAGIKNDLNAARWDPAQRPYSLYTFIVKNAAARMSEQKSQEVKAPATEIEGNVFDIFMETLS